MPEPWTPPSADGLPDGTGDELAVGLNATLKEEFRANPDTFLWGQDVANREKGGIFNVTKGMQPEFGERQVQNAPIAEDYIVGTANGFSRLDDRIRVVIEGAEFADYFWPAAEQLIELSHEYWRTQRFSPNVTIRLASGIHRRRALPLPEHRGMAHHAAGNPRRGARLRRRRGRTAAPPRSGRGA